MFDLGSIKLSEVNAEEFSPAVWAYIGDAVYELFIRYYLLSGGPAKTKFLHREATHRVRASFQAELSKQMESYLTESELTVLKRGRNIKSGHIPNNTDVITYRHSTAFEALIGYLYLTNQQKRLMELLDKVLSLTGVEKRNLPNM
jgi:ribonuclease-3 family protein